MSLAACAEAVRRGDPDRFLSAMAAPPEVRRALFPIYAFNLEVARAPVVTREPLIAEMRLAWWREALAGIAAGAPPLRHEVAGPLAGVLDAEGAAALDNLVEARRRDFDADGFEDAAALGSYLDRTAGTLMWVAARSLGTRDGEADVRAVAGTQGLANWFLACPALAAMGRAPLPDAGHEAIANLAEAALDRLRQARPPRAAGWATLAAWRTRALLGQVARHPERVMAGDLGQSEFARRGSLLLAAWSVRP